MRMFNRYLSIVFVAFLLAPFTVPPTIVGAGQESGMGTGEQTVFAYEHPAKYALSVNYTLKVNGVDVPVIQAYNDYDYAHFSVAEGPVTYEVTIHNTDKVHEYTISPKKLGIQAVGVVGRTLTFTTDMPEYLIVTINSRKTKLVIAADPAETDVPPSSGEGIFNVTAAPYHVVADGDQTGVQERTAAIQRAIDDASAYGTARGNGAQGIVYVPKGQYYIGNLVLKSNMALYLEPGAALIGTGKTADYTEHWFKESMGRPATWWISTEFGSENIKIYGRGTIDGNGKALHDDKSTNGKGMINNLVVPIATSNFKMDGVVIRESAGWAVMPVRSNDLEFTNLKIFNSLGMGENDGIDVVESQNVVVRHSIGIALDDPYSTKTWDRTTDIASGKVPWPGDPEPVDNVLIEDAIAWTLCYGYKIGQGVFQNQSNITIRDAVVYKAAVGFAIHHKYGTGTVSNITFENIDVEDISGKNEDNSAWMTMFTVNGGNFGVGPVTGVTVRNITVRDAGESYAKIKGMEGAEYTNLIFEYVYMPGSSEPAKTLHEMNFLDKEYYSGVTILPVQEPEPRPRTNLALYQPAYISSLDNPNSPVSLAFDGSYSTRTSTKRGVDPGWIYVDLGKTQRINEVHLYWEAAYGKSYQIQVSDDAVNWTDVYSTTNGQGKVEKITFPEVEARYVRMYGTQRATQYGYSLWEFEVYGPEVLPESISLNITQLTLMPRMTEQLMVTILPENATHQTARWSSSDPNVATVNENGLVTAIGPGTATITATTLNGEFKAYATVTVESGTDGDGGDPGHDPGDDEGSGGTPGHDVGSGGTPGFDSGSGSTPRHDNSGADGTVEKIESLPPAVDGKVEVSLDPAVKRVLLSMQAVSSAAGNRLVLDNGSMRVELPQAVLAQLLALVPPNQLQEANVSVRFERLTEAQVEAILPEGLDKAGIDVQIAGQALTIGLSVTTPSGEAALAGLDAPLSSFCRLTKMRIRMCSACTRLQTTAV